MQSELSTDKYNDMRTLLAYAFSTFTGYTDLPAQGITAPLSVVGGGGSLGTVTVSDPGVRLLLAIGLTADDVEVTLELPESYILGSDPEVCTLCTPSTAAKSRRAPACVWMQKFPACLNCWRTAPVRSWKRPRR